jgi:hypothetical protein
LFGLPISDAVQDLIDDLFGEFSLTTGHEGI